MIRRASSNRSYGIMNACSNSFYPIHRHRSIHPIYRQSALIIMRKIRCLLVSMLLATVVSTLAGSEPTVQTSPAPEDKNSRDLFSYESTYTASSDFRGDESKLGDGDSFYGDFSYDHRFLITGNWFFRAGVEYERFEFADNGSGLPDHLQAAYGHLAVEYVIHDHAGAGLELDPGNRKSTRLNSSHRCISYAVFCLKKKKKEQTPYHQVHR